MLISKFTKDSKLPRKGGDPFWHLIPPPMKRSIAENKHVEFRFILYFTKMINFNANISKIVLEKC